MPALFAAAARSLPTSAACSVFVPLKVFFNWPWPAEARPLGRADDLPPNPLMAPVTSFSHGQGRHRLCPLTDLATDVLALVADALALVGLGRPHGARPGSRRLGSRAASRSPW